MPFHIIRNDITKVTADAIVNTANPYPVFAPGTDEAIYRAAGAEELLKEREKIGYIRRGEAAITPAFALHARYIIHTVGPVWIDGSFHEVEILTSCFRSCLKLAEEYHCESIAFPLISTGVYGFPKELAIKTFMNVVYDHLMYSDIEVTLVVYDEESFDISSRIFPDIVDHFDEKKDETISFKEAIKPKEESFSVALCDLIKEKGMSNPEVYHQANITKQHFSKIMSSTKYHPTKNTICALGIALRLDYEALEGLLKKAGYHLSDSSKWDLAIRYFIDNGMYNILEDNLILFENGLEQLGSY